MKQAPGFDGLLFDPFSLFQNSLGAPEIYIGGREVLQALVIAPVVVVIDKGIDLMPEITGQVVVFQQPNGYSIQALFRLPQHPAHLFQAIMADASQQGIVRSALGPDRIRQGPDWSRPLPSKAPPG